MKYKVISFDMFQTLVDINARKYIVWQEILKESSVKPGYTIGSLLELEQIVE
jgi:hypothetical protein